MNFRGGLLNKLCKVIFIPSLIVFPLINCFINDLPFNFSCNDSVSAVRFNDTGLTPFTTYHYTVQAHNQFGYAESPDVTFRTLPGVPSGELELTVTDFRAYSANFQWNQIPDETGDIGM